MQRIINKGSLREELGIGGRRVWLELARPINLAPGVSLTLMSNLVDGERIPVLLINNVAGNKYEWPLQENEYLIAYPYAAIVVEPRVIDEVGGLGTRLLVDLIPDPLVTTLMDKDGA